MVAQLLVQAEVGADKLQVEGDEFDMLAAVGGGEVDHLVHRHAFGHRAVEAVAAHSKFHFMHIPFCRQDPAGFRFHQPL